MRLREPKLRLFVILTVVCLLWVGLFRSDSSMVDATTDDTYKTLKTFADVLSIVQKKYVEDVDSQELVYGAIHGMLKTLDPHSSFLSPEEYKEFQLDTKGSFGGLGIEISVRDGVLTIISPIEDTPAYRAGIQAGDKIILIEGEPSKDMTLMEAVKKLRGKKGTEVTISIWREGFEKLKEITIVRDIIKIQSVKKKDIGDGYGYVRILQFKQNTVSDLEKALKELENEYAGGLKGIVLDLRTNPGGLLDQAVGVSDMFLDSGLIVYIDGRMKSQKMEFSAKENSMYPDIPIVVLVNHGSASASEIVAGALQDNDRAIILGTPTFGKGSVQSIISMEDGSGLKLTTARYFTPDGNDIQAKGITPDIELAASLKKVESKPMVIREADLKNHMKGRDEADPAEEPSEEDEPADLEQEGEADPTEGEVEDIQLERAIELLRSWEIFKKTIGKKAGEGTDAGEYQG
ncbi:S41 family peptidase [Thermodesulfobacteriota bacterium]